MVNKFLNLQLRLEELTSGSASSLSFRFTVILAVEEQEEDDDDDHGV